PSAAPPSPPTRPSPAGHASHGTPAAPRAETETRPRGREGALPEIPPPAPEGRRAYGREVRQLPDADRAAGPAPPLRQGSPGRGLPARDQGRQGFVEGEGRQVARATRPARDGTPGRPRGGRPGLARGRDEGAQPRRAAPLAALAR